LDYDTRVGGFGQVASDYFGSRDTAYDPDVAVTMTDLGPWRP
jgi:hypothetical protein